MRSGACWFDSPGRRGPDDKASKRETHGGKAGVFEKVFADPNDDAADEALLS